MDYLLPSNVASGLAANIASTVASGVLRSVNIVTASVEATVSRTQATIQDVFGAGNRAEQVLEGTISRVDDLATQVRGQLLSAASDVVAAVVARAQAVVQGILNALSGAFSFLVSNLLKLPSLLLGMLRGVMTAFGAILRSGFGVVLTLLRGGGAALGAGQMALGAIPIPAQMVAGLLGVVFRALSLGIGAAIQAGLGAAMAIARIALAGAVELLIGGITLVVRGFVAGAAAALGLLLLPFRILGALANSIAAMFSAANSLFNLGMQAYQMLSKVADFLGITAWQLIQAIGQTLAASSGAIMSMLSALAPIALGFVAVMGAIVNAVVIAVMGAMSFVTRQLANAVIVAFRVVAAAWNQVMVPVAQFIVRVFTGGVQTLARAWNGVVATVGYVMAPLVSGARALFGLVWGGLTSAAGVIGGWLTSSFAFLRQVAGTAAGILRDFFTTTLPGLFSSIRTWVSGLFSRAMSFGGTLLGGVVEFGSRLFGVVRAAATLTVTLTAVGLGAKAIWEAAKSSMEFAKNVSVLSARNGLGFGQNAASLRQFSAFGIGSDVASSFLRQNPVISGTMAGAFGLGSPNSAGFLNQFAERYGKLMGQGFVGQLLAQNMAQVMGLDNDAVLALSQLTRGQRERQTNFAAGINSSLGLSTAEITRLATEIPLALARITVAFTGIKEKLTSIALPLIEQGLSLVATTIGNNTGLITSLLQRAVAWLFVDAPVLIVNSIQTIVTFVGYVVTSLINIGQILLSSIPVWIAGIVQALGQGAAFISGLVSGVADVLTGAMDYLSGLLATWAENVLAFGPIVVDGIVAALQIVGESVGEFLRRLGQTVGQFLIQSGDLFSGWLEQLATFILDMTNNPDNPVRSFVMWIANSLDALITVARRFVGVMAGVSGGLLDAVRVALMASAPALSGFIAAIFGAPDSGFGVVSGLRAANELPEANLARQAMEFFNTSQVFRSTNEMLMGAAGSLRDWTAQTGRDIMQWGTASGDAWQGFAQDAAGYVADFGNRTVAGLGDFLNRASEGIAGSIGTVRAGSDAINRTLSEAERWSQGAVQAVGDTVLRGVQIGTDYLQNQIAPVVAQAQGFTDMLSGFVGTRETRAAMWSGMGQGDGVLAQVKAQLGPVAESALGFKDTFAAFNDRLGGRDGSDSPEARAWRDAVLAQMQEQNQNLRALKELSKNAEGVGPLGAIGYMLNLIKDAQIQAQLNP